MQQVFAWLLDGECYSSFGSAKYAELVESVANVPDAETQYHAHEFLDATVQPKPIYISPNEVYAMHTLLAQHLDQLVTFCLPSFRRTNNLTSLRLGSQSR